MVLILLYGNIFFSYFCTIILYLKHYLSELFTIKFVISSQIYIGLYQLSPKFSRLYSTVQLFYCYIIILYSNANTTWTRAQKLEMYMQELQNLHITKDTHISIQAFQVNDKS